MDDITEEILGCDEISWYQKNMLLLIHKAQLRKLPLTRIDLATELGCSTTTVKKNIKKLKERKIIKSVRDDQRQWIFDLSYFEDLKWIQ